MWIAEKQVQELYLLVQQNKKIILLVSSFHFVFGNHWDAVCKFRLKNLSLTW